MEIGIKNDPFSEKLVDKYGDLIFDLCQTLLLDPGEAESAFREILKGLKKNQNQDDYARYERAWVLRELYKVLPAVFFKKKAKTRVSQKNTNPANFDAIDPQENIGRFDQFFNRLSAQEQILLLLREKYNIPYMDIASATSLPEESLKLSKQQALRKLEDWIWKS